jgi:DNA-binding transcriptional ArsR family regulator
MKADYHLFFETLGTELKLDKINEERSKVSHALLSLHDCVFVNVRKEGKRRIYSLNKDTIEPLLNLVEKHVNKYCKVCKKSSK